MSVVSCRMCAPLVVELREHGFDPELLVEGLDCDIATLQDSRRSIDWDSFTIVLERSARLLGGGEALEDVAFRYTERQLPRLVQSLLPGLRGAKLLFLMGARWFGPWMFRATRATCEELADGRLREVIEILPPYRASPEFFWLPRGIMRAGPRLLGLPEAVVESNIGDRSAEYVITLPPRPRRRWFRAPRRPERMPEELAELGFQQEQLRESLRRTRFANAALAQTSRRLETLNRLARDLAQTTDIVQVGKQVVAVLQANFDVRGVRLRGLAADSFAVETLAVAGDRKGPPDRSLPLRSHDLEIGRLDLWTGAGQDDPEEDAMLGVLLPWISIAVGNARSFDLLSRQTARLQEEIAEHRHTQDELEQTQRLDALGRLAGGLAHDMNNLITGVMGYATLAEDVIDASSPARSDLAEIRDSCERAAGLLHQVLAFSRRQIFVPTVVDLNESIRSVAPMLERLIGENIELVVSPASSPCTALVDPGQIEQIIVNLVTNGRDAIEGTGRVILSTRCSAENVELIVQDDGKGIDPAIRPRIFEPFFTTKGPGEGTGIGLASVFGTVDQFGGRISVESEPGKGARFTVQLPRTALPIAAADTPRTERKLDQGDETILLVEDDESVRRMTRRILETRGYTVIEAPHGADALALCEARGEPIDLLITDIVMPGVDGRELARLLRLRRPELRGVVAMTGYAHLGDGEQPDPPVDACLLHKPFTVPELLSAVREQLS